MYTKMDSDRSREEVNSFDWVNPHDVDSYEVFERLKDLNDRLLRKRREKKLATVQVSTEIKRLEVEVADVLGDNFYDASTLAVLLDLPYRETLRRLSRGVLGEAIQVDRAWYIFKPSVELEVESQADLTRLNEELM